MTLHAAVDRPDARWLPSRHRFAAARLVALVRLLMARPAEKQAIHLVLPIDRDQTSAEINGVAIWVFATTACYIAASLPLPLPVSIALAIPLAAVAIHIPIVACGLVMRLLTGDGNHIKAISVVIMGLLMMASFYAATTATWARFVACFFLAVLAFNGVAAFVLWLLRGAVRRGEERCVR
jgi:hypothetical protein